MPPSTAGVARLPSLFNSSLGEYSTPSQTVLQAIYSAFGLPAFPLETEKRPELSQLLFPAGFHAALVTIAAGKGLIRAQASSLMSARTLPVAFI